MKIRFCLLFLLFALLAGGVVAQNTIDVTGVVHDEDGESIIGATVKVKGTSRGTVTDIDGKFKLPGVKAGEILQISFVGYASIEEKAARQMNIVLHSVAEQLEEVIVTAFGTAKRSAFTGSATVLNSDKLEQKQVTNVMSSLIGEVPGLQIAPSTSPGSTSSILIRGEGSINADNDPLIVLDGMPYDGLWNDINPQDVESVTVLKDAASNALYGARGANGVIIVTTKKGSKGKATVTLNAKWGVNQRSVPDYDRVTNPGEYYELYYKALYNYSVGEGNSPAAAHKWANETLFLPGSNGGLGYNVYTVPENEYLIGTNGKLNPNATLGRRIYKDGEVYTLYPDDWTDALYRNGLRQEFHSSCSSCSTACRCACCSCATVYASMSSPWRACSAFSGFTAIIQAWKCPARHPCRNAACRPTESLPACSPFRSGMTRDAGETRQAANPGLRCRVLPVLPDTARGTGECPCPCCWIS